MSSAACDAWNLTCSRSPMNRNTRERVASGIDDGNDHRTHGLLRCAAARACNARYADSHLDGGTRIARFGHRDRYRLAHGSVLVDEVGLNAEQIGLCLVRVDDDAVDRRSASCLARQ